MQRWPAYTLETIGELTPYQQRVLLSGAGDTETFGSMQEYLEWQAKKRLSQS